MHTLQCEFCTERIYATGMPLPPFDLQPMHALQYNVQHEFCTERFYAPGMPPHPTPTPPTPYDLRPMHTLQCELCTERVCVLGMYMFFSDLRPMHTLQCNVPEFRTERVCAPTERHCDYDGLGQRHLHAGGGAAAQEHHRRPRAPALGQRGVLRGRLCPRQVEGVCLRLEVRLGVCVFVWRTLGGELLGRAGEQLETRAVVVSWVLVGAGSSIMYLRG